MRLGEVFLAFPRTLPARRERAGGARARQRALGPSVGTARGGAAHRRRLGHAQEEEEKPAKARAARRVHVQVGAVLLPLYGGFEPARSACGRRTGSSGDRGERGRGRGRLRDRVPSMILLDEKLTKSSHCT